MIRGLFCVVVTAALALAAGPKAPSTALKPPNVILITLDTTRADRMGFLGSNRGLTPNLDAVARESAVFTRAYAQAPFTPTSHATILTGTYPQYHQVFVFPDPLGKDVPYLPEILKEHGYTTAAFVGSVALDPKVSAPGFDRGFDTYDSGFNWNAYAPGNRYETVERRGEEVVAHALDWLGKHPRRPFFMWVHLYDPHTPYDAPEPYKTRYAKAPYDGEIAYVDSVMGKFFRQLKASGNYDDTTVVLTADHGESLGAHGENEHGIFLYDETIHVPLLIKLPHQDSGKRIENQVELADIMPTVLGELGIAVPQQVQGQSMLGFLQPATAAGEAAGKSWQDRGAYSQADYGRLWFSWSELQSIRSGRYLYVQAPRRELYDESADPEAQHNLASSSSAIADTLSAKVKNFANATSSKHKAREASLDEANARKLAVLGYVAGRPQAPGTVSGEEAPDPKDKIDIVNEMLRINDLLQNSSGTTRCDNTLPELKKALAAHPDFAMFHVFLGGCYLDKGDFPKAAEALREAVKLQPSDAHAQMNLGRALMGSGDYDGALTVFQQLEKTNPGSLDTHIYLIVLYAGEDRPEDVIKECHAVLDRMPDNFGANFNLGQALARTGNLADAIPPLQKAMLGEPQNPGPHLVLADVYEGLGRPEDAKRERAEAVRLGWNPNAPVGPPASNAVPDANKSQRN